MSVLIETNLGGDLVIDLDLKGSPLVCKNFLKLAKVRYYSSCLIYRVEPNRFFQTGDPTGTGEGGSCIYGVLQQQQQQQQQQDNHKNDQQNDTFQKKRFLQSACGRRLTRDESRQRGIVTMTELTGVADTIGSQFSISLGKNRPGDGMDDGQLSSTLTTFAISLGKVVEDSLGILDKIESAYCDPEGRPYADIRILRVHILHDPFLDPPGLWDYIRKVPGMEVLNQDEITNSPNRSKPLEETVLPRIPVNELEGGIGDNMETEEQQLERLEREAKKVDQQRAVVLELLGDLPSADYKAPEHVLFVCKLNPITQGEDLELIFSRFDPNCKAEIIRDPDSGQSLQYAFVEFSNKKQCEEAYFKMNNALVDDRRIKVDFSQSVAKLWNKHSQRLRYPNLGGGNRPPRILPKPGKDVSSSSRRKDDDYHENRRGRHRYDNHNQRNITHDQGYEKWDPNKYPRKRHNHHNDDDVRYEPIEYLDDNHRQKHGRNEERQQSRHVNHDEEKERSYSRDSKRDHHKRHKKKDKKSSKDTSTDDSEKHRRSHGDDTDSSEDRHRKHHRKSHKKSEKMKHRRRSSSG
jgi:peptidyl-prolyl cis-trans isomerase-like 4